MPTFACGLEEDVQFPEKDLKILGSKFKGKDHKVELSDKEAKNGAVTSQPAAQTKVYKQVIEHLGLSKVGLEMLKEAGFEGKLTKAGDYDFVITANRTRHKAILELVLPEAEVDEKPEYTFANAGVKSLADKKTITKIESIAVAGPSEKGHGPVPYLGGALHAHVTNTEGIAWEWKGGKMHVVAIGKKNNQNKEQQRGGKGPKLKTAQYDWTEK